MAKQGGSLRRGRRLRNEVPEPPAPNDLSKLDREAQEVLRRLVDGAGGRFDGSSATSVPVGSMEVLADLLTLAQRSHPAAIIDLATLTGAAVVALGTVTSGLVCNDDRLAERLYAAGEQTGEHIWRLPLRDAYRDMVKSEIADV